MSPKQRRLLSEPLPRMTIVQGCISSGKTWICNHKAVEHIAAKYTHSGRIFFVGRTITTLERNVLEPLAMQYPKMFTYSASRKKAYLCGIRIDLEGCNDITAETKLRGATAEFIYGDELTLWNEPFMLRCMGSLRVPGAAFLGTTNPDSPRSFVYTDYLLRADALSLRVVNFTMADNPSLTPEYIAHVNTAYTGVFHDRFIKGLWVVSEGLVYPMFSPTSHIVQPADMPAAYDEYHISVDYGTHNPTVMQLWGTVCGVHYLIAEYYHSGRESQNQQTAGQYYDALVRLAGSRDISCVTVDPSAAHFIAQIRAEGRFFVRKGKNDVIPGISDCAVALNMGRLKFCSDCVRTIDEFGLYRWDEKALRDAPIKENDHCMDAMRYAVHTFGWAREYVPAVVG